MFEINGIVWNIEQVPEYHSRLRKGDNSFALGSCDSKDRTVYINASTPAYKLKKVLCHEITHAAMFSYGIYMSEDQEELIADLIATYGQEIIDITNKIFLKLKNGNW